MNYKAVTYQGSSSVGMHKVRTIQIEIAFNSENVTFLTGTFVFNLFCNTWVRYF